MAQIFTSTSGSGTREGLVRAMEANVQETAALWGRVLGCQIHSTPEVDWFLSGTQLSMFNGIIRAQLLTENIDAQIERLLAPFRERDLPMAWLTFPSTTPDNLGKYLLKHGLALDERLPGMAVDLRNLPLDEAPPVGITIKVVENAAEMEQWIYTLSEGSSFPPFVTTLLLDILQRQGYRQSEHYRPYSALRKGHVVGTSLLSPGGGLAGIYNVCTLPEERGRGIGRAVTLAALRSAYARGYHYATLQSSKMGLPIYRRLGFEELCTFEFYFLPASTWQAG